MTAEATGGTPPALRSRIIVAVMIGAVCGLAAYVLHGRHGFWPDFVFPWQAARFLLAGRDPYAELPGGLNEPFESPLLYPLPTVLAAIPVAGLSLAEAGGVMMAVSATLLSFVLT